MVGGLTPIPCTLSLENLLLVYPTTCKHSLTLWDNKLSGTVMQIEETLINDHLRMLKVS